MPALLRRFVDDRRGANFAEYLILVAVVALIGLGGFRVFGETIQSRAECLAARIAGGGGDCGGGEGKTNGGQADANNPNKPPFNELNGGNGAAYGPVQGEAFIQGEGDPTAIHPNDVSQGQIGDCYLMSSMAAIAARNPQAIEDLITKNADGTYTVTFREPTNRPWWQFWGSDFKDVKITVTADFPTKNGHPVFAQPGDQNAEDAELWPMILEKAYAQYKGSYNAIGKGGWMGDPMTAMTGEKTEVLGKDVSLETLADRWRDNYAITAATPGEDEVKNNPLFQANGPLNPPLVAGHAYYVINVDEKAGTVTLKNPWGWGTGEFVLTIDQYHQAFVASAATPVKK